MIEVQLPDGRIVEVQTTDPAAAARAAQRLIAVPAPAPAPVQGPPTAEDATRSAIGRGNRVLNEIGALGRGVVDGGTFGFADELAGASAAFNPVSAVMDWATGTGRGMSDRYRDARDAARGANKADEQDRAGARSAGQIIGGIGTGIGLARQGATLAGRAQTLPGRMGLGAVEGAAYGAAQGVGSGENASDRIEGGLMGGLIGAGVGGALPAVGTGVGKAWESVRNAMVVDPMARQGGFTRAAAETVAPALRADGSLGPIGLNRVAQAGPDAMVADMGPNARSLLDTAIQRSGAGANLAREAIDQRVASASTRVDGALDQAFGAPQGATATRTAIRAESAPARGAAYDAAYAQPIDYASEAGRRIESLLPRVPASVIGKANQLMQIEGQASRQILASMADDGTVTFRSMPDVRQIDYITRALRMQAEAGDGAGAMGGMTDLGRAYQALAGELRGITRRAVPEYDQALRVAADPIQRSQAVQIGYEMLRPSVTRDGFAEQIARFEPPQMEALKQGIRSAVDDALARVRATRTDPNIDAREAFSAIQQLSTRDARDKIRMILPEEQAATLFQRLDEAATAFQLNADVARNSATFARGAADARVQAAMAPGATSLLLSGSPIRAARSVLERASGNTPMDRLLMQDEVYSDIARLLTMPAGQARGAANSLINVAGASSATERQKQAIIDAFMSSAPSAGGLASSRAQEMRRGP